MLDRYTATTGGVDHQNVRRVAVGIQNYYFSTRSTVDMFFELLIPLPQ